METHQYVTIGTILIFLVYVCLYIPKQASKKSIVQKIRYILVLGAVGAGISFLQYDDLAKFYRVSFESTTSQAVITEIKETSCIRGTRRLRAELPCWNITASSDNGLKTTNTGNEGLYSVGERVTVVSFKDIQFGEDFNRMEHWFFKDSRSVNTKSYFLNAIEESVPVIVIALACFFSAFAWLLSIFLAPNKPRVPKH